MDQNVESTFRNILKMSMGFLKCQTIIRERKFFVKIMAVQLDVHME